MFHAVPNKNIRRNINQNEPHEMAGIGNFFKKLGSGLKKVAKIGADYSGIPGLSKIVGLIGGNGGQTGQAKGLQQIEAFVSQVLTALDKLKEPASQGIAEVTAAADQLVAVLSDQSKVYQAKKGKDAAALAKGKTDAASKASEIKQLLTAAQQKQANAQTQTNGSILGGADGEIDSSTLMLVGFGGLALILLLKE